MIPFSLLKISFWGDVQLWEGGPDWEFTFVYILKTISALNSYLLWTKGKQKRKLDINSLRYEVIISVDHKNENCRKGDQGLMFAMLWVGERQWLRVRQLWNRGTKSALDLTGVKLEATGWRNAHHVMKEAWGWEGRKDHQPAGWDYNSQTLAPRKKQMLFWVEESTEHVNGIATRNWPSYLLVQWLWLSYSCVTPSLLLHWALQGQEEVGEEWGGQNNKRGRTNSKGAFFETPKLQMTTQAIQVRESTVRIGNCPKWNSFYRIVWK